MTGTWNSEYWTAGFTITSSQSRSSETLIRFIRVTALHTSDLHRDAAGSEIKFFFSLHSFFFHALLILTVEGEYGMTLTHDTASDRNAYTVANILDGEHR
jgi:hypothetical protein